MLLPGRKVVARVEVLLARRQRNDRLGILQEEASDRDQGY